VKEKEKEKNKKEFNTKKKKKKVKKHCLENKDNKKNKRWRGGNHYKCRPWW